MTIYQRFRIWVDEVQSGSLYAGKLLYAAGAIPLFATPIFWRLVAYSGGRPRDCVDGLLALEALADGENWPDRQ
ncbi:hypothetical protein J2Y58_000001 [Sphingomonas sp. BE138]|uniref:hypothetical protein n=1 Tax=Sphingomonas sp. BE138 TaxID=2817845 RepID=UPI0028650853|nr:hypothetical protein [Sphingomonas sp. BE138]MDR6786663.1 hypothetical protein [Sphingomonas sp. BE138]